MIGILVECADHKQVYGILMVKGIPANEVQDKICEIKDELDNNDWEVEDVLHKLPKEWVWTYDNNISKVEI